MKTKNQDFVSKPDEMEYLQRIAQMTDEEIKKAEKEYLAHCETYFNWLNTI